MESGLSIGFKLPPGRRGEGLWRQVVGPHRDVLAFLRDRGMHFVEYSVGDCRSEEELELLLEEARQCAARGLGVNIHPYLVERAISSGDESPQTFEALKAILKCASALFGITGKTVVAVFHPAAARCDPSSTGERAIRDELLEQSRRFFSEARLMTSAFEREVLVVAEHQVPPHASENLIRIGDTFAELMSVARDSATPLCLDTGHYLLSVERHGQPAVPPPEFLRRVAQVHLHDVVEGRDHQPVSEDSRSVRQLMRQLWKEGYAGGVTLEYEPGGILQCGGLDVAIREAVSLLQNWYASSTVG